MTWKKGQKCRLLVHGAGVTTEETTTIASVSKNAVICADGRFYNPQNGHSEVGFAGFWFELLPMKPKKAAPKKKAKLKAKAARR